MTQVLSKNIKGLISKKPSNWLNGADFYESNKEWLDKSALISVKILSALRNQSLSQKDLAERIDVSPQYINKVLKGKENLSLSTICKIEKSLSISLIAVPSFQISQVIEDSFEFFPYIISRNNSQLFASEKSEYYPNSSYSNLEECKVA